MVGDTVKFTYLCTINLLGFATDEFIEDLKTVGRIAARQAIIELIRKNYPALEIDVLDEHKTI